MWWGEEFKQRDTSLILSRKDVPKWKKENSRNSEISPYYRPTVSDAYAFVLNNQFRDNNRAMKTLEFTLIHNWLQLKESQLKGYKVHWNYGWTI